MLSSYHGLVSRELCRQRLYLTTKSVSHLWEGVRHYRLLSTSQKVNFHFLPLGTKVFWCHFKAESMRNQKTFVSKLKKCPKGVVTQIKSPHYITVCRTTIYKDFSGGVAITLVLSTPPINNN
jgi:hypothetical protein